MWSSTLILIFLSICVGTGAWLLFVYATKTGKFEDLEDAKHRMLEDDDAPIDQSES